MKVSGEQFFSLILSGMLLGLCFLLQPGEAQKGGRNCEYDRLSCPSNPPLLGL